MPNQFYPPLLPSAQNPAPRDRPLSVTTDVFNSQYYSGLDVGIYFESFYLDEIVQIQYQVVENRIPYYGYASYTYNRAAAGTRLVQGTFAINFKSTAYIYELLKLIKNKTNPVPVETKKPNSKTFTSIQQALNGDFTLEDFLEQANANMGPDAQLRALTEISDDLNSALWGAPNQDAQTNLTTSSRAPLFDVGPNGFSIYLRYGEPLIKPDILYKMTGDNSGLNARIQDAQNAKSTPLSGRAENDAIGTIHRISGVQITGNGQSVSDSGQVIMEIYSFIGQSIDEAS